MRTVSPTLNWLVYVVARGTSWTSGSSLARTGCLKRRSTDTVTVWALALDVTVPGQDTLGHQLASPAAAVAFFSFRMVALRLSRLTVRMRAVFSSWPDWPAGSGVEGLLLELDELFFQPTVQRLLARSSLAFIALVPFNITGTPGREVADSWRSVNRGRGHRAKQGSPQPHIPAVWAGQYIQPYNPEVRHDRNQDPQVGEFNRHDPALPRCWQPSTPKAFALRCRAGR